MQKDLFICVLFHENRVPGVKVQIKKYENYNDTYTVVPNCQTQDNSIYSLMLKMALLTSSFTFPLTPQSQFD